MPAPSLRPKRCGHRRRAEADNGEHSPIDTLDIRASSNPKLVNDPHRYPFAITHGDGRCRIMPLQPALGRASVVHATVPAEAAREAARASLTPEHRGVLFIQGADGPASGTVAAEPSLFVVHNSPVTTLELPAANVAQMIVCGRR
jgi:hypothetical protein